MTNNENQELQQKYAQGIITEAYLAKRLYVEVK
jgi:hypothetical protein